MKGKKKALGMMALLLLAGGCAQQNQEQQAQSEAESITIVSEQEQTTETSEEATETAQTEQTEQVTTQAQFTISYDEELYEATEEDGVYTIRPMRIEYTREEAIDSISALLEGLSEEEQEQKIQERMQEAQAYYDSMDVGELQITQMQDISIEDAAQQKREELQAEYTNVSEVTQSEQPEGFYLYADNGSQVAELYFVDNGLGGAFIITIRYPVEVTEGHGARYRAMAESFAVQS